MVLDRDNPSCVRPAGVFRPKVSFIPITNRSKAISNDHRDINIVDCFFEANQRQQQYSTVMQIAQVVVRDRSVGGNVGTGSIFGWF
jgi:hypothetical protein